MSGKEEKSITEQWIDRIIAHETAEKDRQITVLRNALRNIQGQCAGHADEFSRRVWQMAATALGEEKT